MNITIRGNEINETVLREVRCLLLKPMKREVLIAIVAAYICMSVVAAATGLWYWLPIFAAIMLFFLLGQPYLRQGRVIEQMIKIMNKTYGKPAASFDVTFEDEAIKSINVATRETVRIPYADMRRMKQGKTVIALVSRRGHLIVLERRYMDEATTDAVLSLIAQKCPRLPA